jgi:DUF4097 and DUF4098 domain-containing protein YvlB
MKTIRLIAPALLALTALPALAADGHFDRTLSVSPGLNLTVSTGSGSIRVTPGSDSQLHISAQIHGHDSTSWLGLSSSDIDARIHQIEANPPIRQSGNAVSIGIEGHNALFDNISIDYEIQAPRGAVLHASTGSGDVQSEEAGSGSSMSAGSGSIRVNSLRGGALLHTGSGDIQLQQTSAGDVSAQTGSGSIRINGFAGGLNAKSGSGDIQVEGHPTADWQLHTGSGSIRLGLGHDAHATLDADTGSGSIAVSQPMVAQTAINRHHIHATINGGGPLIHTSTGSGDVEIH